MEQFVIEGGTPLTGTVRPAGNKNSALPLLAASLLTDQPVTLHNVPRIRDVLTMRQLIEDVGAVITEIDPHTWRIEAKNLNKTEPDPALCRIIRASLLLAAPLLARRGHVELPLPGGDVIGRRRIDSHLIALK
ncbi:MAG: UDP-N-acetylglucosamine 1-carboxyvinyltransferase, partial [Chloroflexi bacterium]|nr:UDP-N-acetylglucosamine 1-carboxyvinyltransferase [Chloroflexota bacterium]